MSKVLAVAQKTLRELVRQPKSLGLTLGLPVAFMLIFGFVFGVDDGQPTYTVAFLDKSESADWSVLVATRPDGGPAENETRALREAGQAAFGSGPPFASRLHGALEAVTYDDGSGLFALKPVADEDAGRALIAEAEVQALVVLPPDYNQAIAAAWFADEAARHGLSAARPHPATLRILGDPSSSGYQISDKVVASIHSGMVAAILEREAPPVTTQAESVAARDSTPFDFIAPGLMIFAILNMAAQSASLLAKENERRTLDRLRITQMRASDLLGGVALAQVMLGSVAVTLMMIAALAMGFNPQGSLWVGLLVGLVTTVSVIGVGMLIASFARTQDDAANLGVLFAVPGSFLSGAFFPIPAAPLFAFGGRTIEVYDILPSTHAVNALRGVLTFGQSLGDVAFEFAAMAVLSAVFLGAGTFFYARKRMRN